MYNVNIRAGTCGITKDGNYGSDDGLNPRQSEFNLDNLDKLAEADPLSGSEILMHNSDNVPAAKFPVPVRDFGVLSCGKLTRSIDSVCGA